MKFIFFGIIISFFPILSFSQTFNLGLRAGINQSNRNRGYGKELMQSFPDGSFANVSNSSRTGFNIGPVAEFTNDKWTFQTALFYMVKGDKRHEIVKTSSNALISDINNEIQINYLQVPLSVLYHIRFTRFDILVGGGPYIAFGISGKATSDGYLAGSIIDNQWKVRFGDEPSNNTEVFTNRNDIGLNGQISSDVYKGLNLSLNYDHTLSQVANRVFSLNIGYRFFTAKKPD